MTINLSSLVLDVRDELSDIPEEYLSDRQVFKNLDKAKFFVYAVKTANYGVATSDKSDAELAEEELYIEKCVVALAVYYAYINWTSTAERALGEMPQSAYIKLASLRKIALGFIQMISDTPLNDDLTINEKAFSHASGIASGLSTSIIGDGDLV